MPEGLLKSFDQPFSLAENFPGKVRKKFFLAQKKISNPEKLIIKFIIFVLMLENFISNFEIIFSNLDILFSNFIISVLNSETKFS